MTLTVAYNEYLTVSTVLNRFRNDCSFHCSLVFLIFLTFSSWDFFFYSRVAYSPPNVLSSKCTLHIPEASPTIILKENHWWIEWQSVASLLMFCIAVLKNAAVLCGGIYLINISFNPCKEWLLCPSPCSIWSPCKHSALWSRRTNLRWIASLLHGFTDTLSEAQTLQIAVCVLSRCVISLIFHLYAVCGSLKGHFWC